jgi:ethanolamine utilization protein EutA (predicted chaperonin)
MKKLVVFLTMMMGTLAIHAVDYTYLTFETTDGAKASVSVGNLTLSISGTTLTAGSQSFTLSNLSKMYFSTSDETTTGIEEITNAALDEATDIYDLQGHKFTKEQMRKGVYIVKTKNRTYKIVVR